MDTFSDSSYKNITRRWEVGIVVEIEIPDNYFCKVFLEIREKIIVGYISYEVVIVGFFVYGCGEVFDYFIGEKTNDLARHAIRAAVVVMLFANHPVISVNGNVCALVPEETV